ncbi:MAG: aminopeptidase [Planctomycetota bacterium]|jgi:aminopeptidase
MNQFSHCASISDATIDRAEKHIADILSLAFEHTTTRSALVVFDSECDLAVALTTAYRKCLPDAAMIEFDSENPEQVLQAFEPLNNGDLVVLIQSTSFRLASFRIRLELFRRSIKVIEHPHLSRMPGEQSSVYIDSLAYDPAYYRGVGHALKERIDKAETGVVHSGDEQLTFGAGFEPAKLNVGDYREMQNIGGQYPIGEVFTESKELTAVNGRVQISFFGDSEFRVNKPAKPITLVVENGLVTDTVDSTPELDRVLDNIRASEGQVWLRELGFGMNRAFTQTRTVDDIGTFERMCGMHLSLGSKHVSYNKPEIRKKTARHHVDVFVLTGSVVLDGEQLYRDGNWIVG